MHFLRDLCEAILIGATFGATVAGIDLWQERRKARRARNGA